MDDDQQFCLRWNNHQSTLISVFDTLLENETLVDCTLAAEGKFLKAHKVVLSACSPYFATLLSEQYDKHPIFILKDVKYQELRAMMDYMYRGEVNISQDQLAALLKAAESLQIKGLSDNRTGSGNSSSGLGGVSQQQQQQKISAEQQHKHISVPGKLMTGSASAGYTLEQTKRSRIGPSSIDSQDLSGSREGSSSPTSRRRKKVRRRSIENVLADNHDNSNSSQVIQGGSSSIVPTTNATGTITAMLPMIGSGVGGTTTTISSSVASTITVAAQQQLQQQQQQASAATAAANIITANVTKKTESVKMGGNTDAMNAAVTAVDNIQDENAADSIDEKEMIMKEKQNHKRPKHQHEGVVATSTGKDEIVIEPKSEYDDEGNDETVEDLTLDDEEMGLEDLDHNAGPSHGGEGSSQGYAQWQVDRSQDEVFMAAQEAQQRDPQVKHDKSEQTDITPEEFELDDCLLESNDIVITQNKDGFVLHVKKLSNVTSTKITTDDDQSGGVDVSAATGHAQITEVQDLGEVKPTLTTLTTSHAIKLPSAECELINLKKVTPTTTISVPHTTTATIIQPQIHQEHHPNIVCANAQAINTLIGLRSVQIEPKNLGPRIKYSRGKIISPQGTTIHMEPEKQDQQQHHQHQHQHHHHQDINETTKYEISEIDLNNAQTSASIISDLVKYAEIDDIELPDGTKIGIGFAPTEITELHTTQSTQQITEHHQQQHHHQHQQQQQQQQLHNLHQSHQQQTDESMEQVSNQEPTITKSYTILTTRPMKQENSSSSTTTYELTLSDSSLSDTKYICRHCGKKYRWKSTLRRHENVECGGKEPCHPCPHCSYKAKQRGNLGVHVRKHHPDKPQLESKRGRKY
ncbi:longitudinals lacking protein, isoforms F/I/K/T isoform X2 [Eupeodes corollae]|uniref:longitudinals lacking protein, isoforms F/I/K/T isoform X2 n=1 Tax=Eupeodes corollae TaxID=290404 RepID=UPI0024906735|nr:longitudinals lacking protein, isoforms F/I/K/T isoform X2 [Eupeodes corollae]